MTYDSETLDVAPTLDGYEPEVGDGLGANRTSEHPTPPSGDSAGGNILREAAKLMEGDRAEAYGEASVMFAKIRDLWNAYLGVKLTSQDVAMMLSLMKAARVKVGAPRPDNFVDGAAYVAFAGSL